MAKITITVERRIISNAIAALEILREDWNNAGNNEMRNLCSKDASELRKLLNNEAAIAEADAKSHCFKCKGEMDSNECALCDSCEHWFCYKHIQSGVDCDLCDDCLKGLAEAEKEEDGR